jgi:hypothetical protein
MTKQRARAEIGFSFCIGVGEETRKSVFFLMVKRMLNNKQVPEETNNSV